MFVFYADTTAKKALHEVPPFNTRSAQLNSGTHLPDDIRMQEPAFRWQIPVFQLFLFLFRGISCIFTVP